MRCGMERSCSSYFFAKRGVYCDVINNCDLRVKFNFKPSRVRWFSIARVGLHGYNRHSLNFVRSPKGLLRTYR